MWFGWFGSIRNILLLVAWWALLGLPTSAINRITTHTNNSILSGSLACTHTALFLLVNIKITVTCCTQLYNVNVTTSLVRGTDTTLINKYMVKSIRFVVATKPHLASYSAANDEGFFKKCFVSQLFHHTQDV